jgi:predicted metal-dependent hydrolase
MKNNSYQLQIIPSPTRKTIAIQVYPDCSVKVRVPKWLSQKKINEIIEQKQDWINNKLEYFQQTEQPKKKEYISGESFYYLGKQYKLKIITSQPSGCLIERTRDVICIYKTEKRNTKNILTKWFFNLSKEVFEERLKFNFEIFSKQYKYNFPILKIKKLKARWGSMSSMGVMTLNTHLVHTPVECIDYVIMHELCHLKYKNHGKKFHQLQAKFNSNYKGIKKRLEDFNNEIKLL